MNNKLLKLMFFLCVSSTWAAEDNSFNPNNGAADLQTSATSAKLLNLGALLGGAGGTATGGYYPRPNYYPTTGGYYPQSGYYPNTGYYPSSGSYPSGGYYPSTGTYPSSGYYPSTGSYPSTSGGYYPTTGGGYYPSTAYPTWNSAGYYPAAGTNILGGSGNGGYGGYGGNGGLRQYDGYWNPNYVGRRNLGYGYYKNTDRYGLPKTTKDRYGGSSSSSSHQPDPVSHSYRAYD